ncbi:MAG: nitric oxide synthase [Brachymonas sp.]|nr:nitric oxide synthase [Brachymonas sp.]
MNTLKIFVATMTGTAEYVAQAIQMDCSDLIQNIEVTMMDNLRSAAFEDRNSLYLICSSTYGAGDVPDNGQALYASLDSEPRDLSHVRYGVIALGDFGSYPNTFAGGGKRFDERLTDLDAQRIGEVFTHDASGGTMPETDGTEWARSWLTQALQAA